MLRWTFRIVLILLVVGGIVAWNFVGSDPGLAIDEGLVKQAQEDGSGAAAIRLDPRPEWEPQTLAQARALLCDDELENARERLEGFAGEHPENGAAHILLAEVLRRQEKLDEAEAHIEKGLALLPTQGSAYYVHARILAKKLEHLATQGGAMGKLKAMKQIGPYRSALQTAIELDPKNVDARKEEILFYLFTPGIGDKEVAIEKARELRSVHAMEGDLSLARALYYSDKKANAEIALEQVRAAITEYPEVSDPNWILGSILFDEKRYEEADVALAKVIDSGMKNETYYQALYRRMRVRTRAGLEPEAVLAYVDEYLEANPCWEWAPRLHQVYCERGRALAALGRKADARVAFEKSLELMPGYERAERGLEGL